MQKLRKIIARNVREFRLKAELSQAELGKLSGLTGRFISSLESGQSTISVDNLESIASALGIKVETLLGINGNSSLVGSESLKKAIKILEGLVGDE